MDFFEEQLQLMAKIEEFNKVIQTFDNNIELVRKSAKERSIFIEKEIFEKLGYEAKTHCNYQWVKAYEETYNHFSYNYSKYFIKSQEEVDIIEKHDLKEEFDLLQKILKILSVMYKLQYTRFKALKKIFANKKYKNILRNANPRFSNLEIFE